MALTHVIAPCIIAIFMHGLFNLKGIPGTHNSHLLKIKQEECLSNATESDN